MMAAAGSVLLASLIIILGCLYDYFDGLQEKQMQDELTLAAAAIEESGQAYLKVIMAFVGVAAGIVILIAAFNFATGKNVFRSIPVVAIIPPLMFCINLITLFTNYTNVS